MNSGKTGRRAWCLRVGLGLSIMAMALATSVGIAGAKKHHPKAKLNITVPGTVDKGASWSLQATGKSGDFNRLAYVAFSVASFGSGCKSTEKAEANQQGLASLTNQAVSKNHAFNVSHQFFGEPPFGTHQVCVYLYKKSSPAGAQQHKAATYQVAQG